MTPKQKADLIEKLTLTCADQEQEIQRLGNQVDHAKRQTANVSRVFVTLYEEKRTLDLRFGWLEGQATEVVNACPKHLPGEIESLADELGIERKEN